MKPITNHKPRRQGKGDRLLSPGCSADEVAADHAVAPFDRAARQMEQTWGIDRLPELVSPETAAKFGSAMAKLNAALAANDPKEVAARAAVCMRGLHVMDAEARAAGRQPIPSSFWMHEQEGRTIIIAQDQREWPMISEQFPGVPIYSLREVFNALQKYGSAVAAAKAQFPGSQIRKPEPIKQDEMNDPVPF